MKYFIKAFSSFVLVLMLMTAVGVGCASTPKSEGTGEYLDDSVITSKIKTQLINEPNLKSADIQVETFKGVVQLSGFANSRADINRALEIARGVGGVKSVKNAIRLK